MNILHMKYAAEVAKAGSINKAAENLMMAQPNLSRAIKELENSLGITIFDRSIKGMCLTPDGTKFMGYAQNILDQIDDMEKMYRSGIVIQQKFSVSVPRASYISQAFAQFSKTIAQESAEIFFKETNTAKAVNNILSANYKLAVIRYASELNQSYMDMLKDKEIHSELVAEFRPMLLINKDSKLAGISEIHFSDLSSLIEVVHDDPIIPYLPPHRIQKNEPDKLINRKIYVFDRAGRFDLLTSNRNAFMWVSPAPTEILDKYGLLQRVCNDNHQLYRDVLIYRKNYHLTEMDKRFIAELFRVKKKYMG